MGYSVSQETYERIERNRLNRRLCQGSSRCSQRATRFAIALLDDNETENVGGGTTTYSVTKPAWRWSVMVMCKRHADEMIAWPAYVNGANLAVLSLDRMNAEQIITERDRLEARPITEANINEARHRMAEDAIRRQALARAR